MIIGRSVQTNSIMKRKSLLLLIACCACTLAYSQAQFAIGIKAGPNFANINTDATAGENYKSRTGFHGGAFALIKLSKFGIQPELIFSQQGSKVKLDNQDLESNYSYINIPVMLKLYLVAGLNLQVGPQFGFVSSAKQEFVDDLGNVTKENIKSEMKKTDISAGLGAGWDLPFGLTIDARYNLGLSKLYDHEDAPDAKNQVFQFSLGYKLFKFGN
jgi:hypothetical protein